MSHQESRNLELMTAMIERRTDRAYPLFLDCLRRSGQSQIADLLTDVTLKEEVTDSNTVDDGRASPVQEDETMQTAADEPASLADGSPSEMDAIREGVYKNIAD